MSHTGHPVILKSQNKTLVSNLNRLYDLSKHDTEIEIRGPVNLGQIKQPVQAQVKERPLIWTVEEDTLLHCYILEKGKIWPEVALSINRDIHNSVNVRSSSSCRERWRNNHKPSLNSNRYLEKRWTQQEDFLLLDLYNILGGSWRCIARQIPGRTEYSIKKRYQKLMIYRRHFASHGIQVAPDSSSDREDELQYENFIS
jgi:hypothetical protein